MRRQNQALLDYWPGRNYFVEKGDEGDKIVQIADKEKKIVATTVFETKKEILAIQKDPETDKTLYVLDKSDTLFKLELENEKFMEKDSFNFSDSNLSKVFANGWNLCHLHSEAIVKNRCAFRSDSNNFQKL